MRRTLALSPEGLRACLEVIDEEGWDGSTGSELLRYVRANLVRIQIRAAGLTGPAGEQAEATGWEVAWETLRGPGLRSASWPWAVLWIAVRRAVRGEWAAGAYLTNPRTAWDLRRVSEGCPRTPVPLCWDRLAADGQEWAPDTGGTEQPLLARVVELLAAAGWDLELAAQVVLRLADRATVCDGDAINGWRQVAAELGLPPWQVRRVAKLLYAVARRAWPGHEPGELEDRGWADLSACVTATVKRRPRPTPTLIAS